MVTGLIRADAGTIRWGGEDGRELVRMPPWSIFRLGISRTFQNIRLSLVLSIIENVMVGFYLQERTGWVDVALGRRFVQVKQTQARERAEEAIPPDPLT